MNELYLANKLDEALGELAFVVVIDPLNEEVLRLEQKILETQEQQQQQQLELYQKQLLFVLKISYVVKMVLIFVSMIMQ